MSDAPDTNIIEEQRGWYSRHYLPHADFAHKLQSITYRLWDSLPQKVLVRIQEELKLVDIDRQKVERRRKIESWLDTGIGCCALADPTAAKLIIENWKHFDQKRYDLVAYVVMPNHVHVLIRPYEGNSLGEIIRSWKTHTGRWINEGIREGRIKVRRKHSELDNQKNSQLGEGAFWMREYWDRYIRDENHYNNTVRYIHNNPVKAGLVKEPEHWPFSSATR